jgi:hypothetical protein
MMNTRVSNRGTMAGAFFPLAGNHYMPLSIDWCEVVHAKPLNAAGLMHPPVRLVAR